MNLCWHVVQTVAELLSLVIVIDEALSTTDNLKAIDARVEKNARMAFGKQLG